MSDIDHDIEEIRESLGWRVAADLRKALHHPSRDQGFGADEELVRDIAVACRRRTFRSEQTRKSNRPGHRTGEKGSE